MFTAAYAMSDKLPVAGPTLDHFLFHGVMALPVPHLPR